MERRVCQNRNKGKKEEGSIVSLPKGTFLKFFTNDLIYPLKGTIISGEIEELYPSKNPILLFKPASLKPYPVAPFTIKTLPEGTIIPAKSLYLTGDKKIAYINYRGLRGFISTDGIARLEPVEKVFAFSNATEKLRTYPGGEFLAEVPLGETLKSIYFCPYFDAYFVETSVGKGWLFAKALKELHFKPVNKEAGGFKGHRHSDCLLRK